MQRRLAQLLTSLPEARDFALAGGAALIARGIIDRGTQDLDFFATSAAAVGGLLPVLEARLEGEGLSVTRIRDLPGFARLQVAEFGGETVQLELAGAKDLGFSQERFSESLAALHRLREEDFLVTGRTYEDLTSQFDAWREQLDQSRGS